MYIDVGIEATACAHSTDTIRYDMYAQIESITRPYDQNHINELAVPDLLDFNTICGPHRLAVKSTSRFGKTGNSVSERRLTLNTLFV